MKYWEVEGNFWSKSKYSKAQAIELSKSLINCQNCIDCLRCGACVSLSHNLELNYGRGGNIKEDAGEANGTF